MRLHNLYGSTYKLHTHKTYMTCITYMTYVNYNYIICVGYQKTQNVNMKNLNF